MNWIDSAIDKLLIKPEGEINSRLEQVGFELNITDTKAKGYCYSVKLDGNGNVRWKDLVDYIALSIVDYSIPKKEIDAAKEYFNKTRSTSKIINLKRKATELFTDLKTTGEGGEMLLYILIQEFLKIPQLISKMSIKTSGNMHYHGVDGIHVQFDSITDNLILYWGESKMFSNVNDAIQKCFESLNGFMVEAYGSNSTHERDLQLISSNISQNVNDEKLENLLVRYFDKDDDLSNKIQYKGVCFIGFDFDMYPTQPLTTTTTAIKKNIEDKMQKWLDKTSENILKHNNLNLYEMHVFLIPFPSVQDFRDYFIHTINS